MLLHCLGGLDYCTRSGDTHAHHYRHRHRDSHINPVDHPLNDGRPISHTKPAYRYIDIHPVCHVNVYSHGHAYARALVDAVPAAYIYTYFHLDTHSSNGDIHILAGASYIYVYSCHAHGNLHVITAAADGDIYVITAAAYSYLYPRSADSDGYLDP